MTAAYLPRLALVVGLAAAWTGSTGCATSGAVPRPFPVPGPTAADDPAGATGRIQPPPPHATTVDGYAVAGTALALRGAPYRSGGSDPTGFDCSGFVQYVFGRHGVGLPRGVRELFGRGREVDASDLSPGDLLFFSTKAPGVSHVAIAIGGDQFVHAPSSNGVVRVEALGSSYWAGRYLGARRISN